MYENLDTLFKSLIKDADLDALKKIEKLLSYRVSQADWLASGNESRAKEYEIVANDYLKSIVKDDDM